MNKKYNDLVSVCIPCYNQPQYIKQAIDSVLNQTYKNIEIIISDDSNNDETEKIINETHYPPNVIYSKNHSNLGRVKNYRKLLYDLSKGKYVLMLDGDDFLLDNNFIDIAIKKFNNDKNVILVAGGVVKYDELSNKYEEIKVCQTDVVFRGKNVFENPQFLACHQSSIYIRELSLALNFYNYESIGSDSESLYRYYLMGDIVYLKNVVSCWRIHKNNSTFIRNVQLQLLELDFINSIFSFASNYIHAETLKKWRSFLYYNMLLHIFSLIKSKKRIYKLFVVLKFREYLLLKQFISLVKIIIKN